MSQTIAPYGLSLFENKGAGSSFPTFTYTMASGYGVSLGAGDPVSICPPVVGGANGGNIVLGQVSAGNFPTVINTVGANVTLTTYPPLVGVFQGVQYTDSQGNSQRAAYWPAGTTTFTPPSTNVAQSVNVIVNDLPYCIFKIQSNALVTSAQVMGNNYNFTPGVASSSQKTSTFALNTTQNGGAGGGLYGFCTVIGIAPSTPGNPNNWGDPVTDLLVMINYHRYKAPVFPGASLPN